MDTPAMKKTPPKMVNAQGLKEVKLFPKMPNTPNIKAIMPPTVKINANIRIIKFYFNVFTKFKIKNI